MTYRAELFSAAGVPLADVNIHATTFAAAKKHGTRWAKSGKWDRSGYLAGYPKRLEFLRLTDETGASRESGVWVSGRGNPRRVRANSTTLRNLASVKITRNRDGTVGKWRMRRDDGEWRIFRMVPAYGYHSADVRRQGIEEFYGTAERRTDAAQIVRELNRKNPRRVRSNSTTLHNLASVKITRNRDGTVGIVARRNAPKHAGSTRRRRKR